MKKLVLVSIFTILCNLTMRAQTEKGHFFFGADAGFSFSSMKNDYGGPSYPNYEFKSTTFSITPSANYFIVNDLSLGLDLSFSTAKSESSFENAKYRSHSFSVVPTATYFFSSGKFRPYLSAGAGYGFSKGNSDESKLNSTIFKGKGGIAYFFNSNVALNAGLEYRNSNYKNKNTDAENKINTLAFTTGFSIFF